jgi:hypothetical protein
MRKLLILAAVVLFSFFFALSSVVWAELDCKWVQVKDQRGVGYKCIGKDCSKCIKEAEEKGKAKGGHGKPCCKCYPDGICFGTCCPGAPLPSVSPFK